MKQGAVFIRQLPCLESYLFTRVMIIECAYCKNRIAVSEELFTSVEKQFYCSICHGKQEIITVKIEEEKEEAGKLHIYQNNKYVAGIPIFFGKNVVGRVSREKRSDIEISNDAYIGRRQFVLEILRKRNGQPEYVVYEETKPSNKTTVIINKNAKELRVSEKILISDGNKITAGITTFILEEEKRKKISDEEKNHDKANDPDITQE